jgi:hypothetical protein
VDFLAEVEGYQIERLFFKIKNPNAPAFGANGTRGSKGGIVTSKI